MSEVLEQPAAAAPAATPPAAIATKSEAAPLSIRETVLAQFREHEPVVMGLANRYRSVAYDCATTKGMNEAKAARLELREKGRFAIQRSLERVKDEVNSLKRVMTDESERLIALVKPVEDAVHAQITAEEGRKEAERQRLAAEEAERKRIEAERIAHHQAGIAKLRGYLTAAREKQPPAQDLAKGIDVLKRLTFGADWQEFATEAAQARDEVVAGLQVMHDQTLAREQQAAEVERQRLENERRAAQLAEQQRQIDEQARQLAAQQEQAAAALAAEKQTAEAQHPQQVLKAEPASADATDRGTAATVSPRVGAMGAGQAADAAPAGGSLRMPFAGVDPKFCPGSNPDNPQPYPDDATSATPDAALETSEDEARPYVAPTSQPMVPLGKLQEWLGMPVTADALAGLGFPFTPERAAKLYRPEDFRRIAAALAKHFTALANS